MPPPDDTKVEFLTLSVAEIAACEEAFVGIAADVPGEYWTLAHLLRDLPEKWALSFAAWREHDPIGYAILSRKTPGRIHLHHLMIAATQRGKGLGARMVGEIAVRSWSAGADRLTLKVKSSRARRFYRRHGFTQIGQDGHYAVLERTLANLPPPN